MEALKAIMEAVKANFERKWVLPVIGLVVGIGLGLLYAWVISPVKLVDVAPRHLREDLRIEYLRMVIDSYSIHSDTDVAVERYLELGGFGTQTLESVAEDPRGVSETAIQELDALFEFAEGTSAVSPEVAGARSSSLGQTAMRLILPVCGVTLLLGLLLAGGLVLRSRLGDKIGLLRRQPDFDEDLDRLGFEYDDEEELDEEPEPLATFRTTYTLGGDHYDESFSIENASGDFLGECGVGIGDIIGVGDAKKVSAFEVWLFDKNDIQTVTKVLMSQFAFKDDETRNRLAAKGDPVRAENGGVVMLETASLK
ncbi:MAG: hypothetical protein PVF70_11275, partial [Anaerolineales bacterium]